MNAPKRTASIAWSIGAGLLFVLAGLALLRVELTIRAPGTVRAFDEDRVFAPAAGTIQRLATELGQVVSAGDLLVQLDDTEIRLAEVRIERDLSEARAAQERNRIEREELTVRPAEADLVTADDRERRLARIAEIQREIETNYTSGRDLQIISDLEVRKQEIERLRSELELVQANLLATWQESGAAGFAATRAEAEARRLDALVKLLERELDIVRAQRDALSIRAPRPGRVVVLHPRFAGVAVARGDEILKLASPDKGYIVRTLVPERNIDLVRVGSPVRMESAVFDAILEGRLRGRVARVAPESDPTAGTETEPRYEIDIEVTETPYPLTLGSRVNARIQLGRRPIWEIVLRSARSLRDDRG